MPVKLGWIRDRRADGPRARPFGLVRPDFILGAMYGSDADYVIPSSCPILTQDAEDCVSNATAAAFKVRAEVLGVVLPLLSRRAIQYHCRLVDGTQGQDVGTYVVNATSTLARLGAPAESLWPYTADPYSQPALAAEEGAYDHKIAGHFQIADGALADVALAVRAAHPVIFGVEVTQSFVDFTGVRTYSQSGKIVGGHCMVIDGVRGNGAEFRVRNSWGTGWGEQGVAWVDAMFVASGSDFHVVTL